MAFKQYSISIDFLNDVGEDCLHKEIVDGNPIPTAGFLGVVRGAPTSDGLQIHYTSGTLLPSEESALDIIIAAHDPDNCPIPVDEGDVPASDKGQPGGVPDLDQDGYVPINQLPFESFAHVFTIANSVARISLTPNVGDEAIQQDDNSQWLFDDGYTWIQRPTSGNNFGNEYDYNEKTSNKSTSSTSFQQYNRFTTQSLIGGDYRIGWYFVGGPSDDEALKVRVQLDDSMNLTSDNYISSEEDENKNNHIGGFVKINLSSGVHNIDIDFKTADDEESVTMKNSRIEIWRV